MTPDTIRQAVYEIGHATETEHEATLGGSDLGRMLVNQFEAAAGTRQQLGAASRAEVESILTQLATSPISFQAKIAGAALMVWRHAKG